MDSAILFWIRRLPAIVGKVLLNGVLGKWVVVPVCFTTFARIWVLIYGDYLNWLFLSTSYQHGRGLCTPLKNHAKFWTTLRELYLFVLGDLSYYERAQLEDDINLGVPVKRDVQGHEYYPLPLHCFEEGRGRRDLILTLV